MVCKQSEGRRTPEDNARRMLNLKKYSSASATHYEHMLTKSLSATPIFSELPAILTLCTRKNVFCNVNL